MPGSSLFLDWADVDGFRLGADDQLGEVALEAWLVLEKLQRDVVEAVPNGRLPEPFLAGAGLVASQRGGGGDEAVAAVHTTQMPGPTWESGRPRLLLAHQADVAGRQERDELATIRGVWHFRELLERG